MFMKRICPTAAIDLEPATDMEFFLCQAFPKSAGLNVQNPQNHILQWIWWQILRNKDIQNAPFTRI